MDPLNKRKTTLLQNPEVLQPRDRAKVFYQHGHVEQVIPLLEPILKDISFSAEYYNDFTVFIESCFIMMLRAKTKESKLIYLKKAHKYLTKCPEKYQNFIFDKAVISYYFGYLDKSKRLYDLLLSKTTHIDHALKLYIAKLFIRMKKTKEAKAIYFYLAGLNLPETSINDIIQGHINFDDVQTKQDNDSLLNEMKRLVNDPSSIGTDLDHLEVYDIGFGPITLEEMNNSVKVLYLYQNRNKSLHNFEDFIANRNISMAHKKKVPTSSVGSRFFKNKAYSMCLRVYEKIPKDNRTPDIEHEMAYSYYNMGEYQQAIDLYEKLLKNQPNQNPHMLLEVAEAYICLGHFNVAQKRIAKAEDIAPNNPNVLYTQGLYNYLRAQDEMAKTKSNINIWAKHMKLSMDSLDRYKQSSPHIKPEHLSTIEAVELEWQKYKEQQLYKHNI